MAKETPAASAQPLSGLRITSRVEGFYRAGRPWSTTPEDVAASDFSAAQIAQLQAEPMLTVVSVDLPVKG